MAAVTHNALTNYQATFRSPPIRSGGVGDWIKRTIRLWRSRSRERRSFEFLNDRELQDLRLSRWEVEREIAKPFWRG